MRVLPLRIRPTSIAFLALGLSLPLPAFAAGRDFTVLFYTMLASAMPVWIPIAVLAITVAGFTAVIATQEGAITKARSAIVSVIVGGMLIMLGGVILRVFYTLQPVPGTNGALDVAPVAILSAEALGIVGWISAMAGMFGLLFVIIAAISAVGSFGQNEESYTKVRVALLHVIFGLVIMAGGGLISNAVSGGTPNPIIILVLGKIQILLSLITGVALGILVYAGFRMVTNFGNEEVFSSAKSLAIRVVMGLAIILLAYVMTIFVAQIF